MRNLWDILGIEPTENQRAIKKAYAKQCAKYHPEDYPNEFQEIQFAYKSILESLTRDYEKRKINFEDNLQEGFAQSEKAFGITESDQSTHDVFEYDIEEDPIGNSNDDFDLDWSFRHKDEKKRLDTSTIIDVHDATQQVLQEVKIDDVKQKPMEQPMASNDDIMNHILLRFQERLKYSCDEETMKLLILNNTFFQMMNDEAFYHKITTMLQHHINRFDSFTISFLFDAFTYINEAYGYPSDQYNMADFIRAIYIKKTKNKKRIEIISIIALPLFLVGIILLAVTSAGMERNKKTEQNKIDTQMIDVWEEQNKQKKELGQKNTAYLEQYMLEQFNEGFTCTIYITNYAANSTTFYDCIGTTSQTSKFGKVSFGEDRLINKVQIDP